MITGQEYLQSDQKRSLDLLLARSLAPAAFGGRIVMSHVLRGSSNGDDQAIFLQDRVGSHETTFTIEKLRTLCSVTGLPKSVTTSFFRRFGMDEVAQIANINSGEMSFVGWRPLPVPIHEEIMASASADVAAEWRATVSPTKPGMLSSFAIMNHQRGNHIRTLANTKLMMDIADVNQASIVNDLRLISSAITAALQGKT